MWGGLWKTSLERHIGAISWTIFNAETWQFVF